MKLVQISMPDTAPIVIHEAAVHIPNLGIATIGAHLDRCHDVFIIDLVRKRNKVRRYLTKILPKLKPDLIGLSAMAWQYDTCVKIAKLIKTLLPHVKIVIGGYHATLMASEIARTSDAALFDFMVRGEGEEACRRLMNALQGSDQVEDIPSLSYKKNGRFIHNPRGELCDLSDLKLPIRDKRRLTWGYHLMNKKMEVIETSRGCTRGCNFCSIRRMYGRSFRTFPIERVLADLDNIYYQKKAYNVFVTDDNMVLNPKRVIALCDAIIQRNYQKLVMVVQADCVSMAQNESMVQKMAQAGFKIVFLGIENISKKNLTAANKGNIVEASKTAIKHCHKYGMMIIGGLVLGFPDDDEETIKQNYEFFNEQDIDAAICQILTPYPKTGIRENLLKAGLVSNFDDFRRYTGLWANVRTKHLSTEQLQYLVWFYRQTVLGWWNPSKLVQRDGKLWTGIWRYAMKPVLQYFHTRQIRKHGWKSLYAMETQRLAEINVFKDLEEF